MKIAISELEHLREEVKNCHQIIRDLQKKRDWVDLTDEEIEEIAARTLFPINFARAIEAAHGIKENT